MRKSHIIIGACSVLFLFVVLFVTAASMLKQADAQAPLPEEEQSWIQSITTGAKEWQTQMDIESAAHAKRLDLESTVSPLRVALCKRYHVVIDNAGVMQKAEACPTFH